MRLTPSRIEHEREVGAPDPTYECVMGVRLELDRAFVDEGVDVVDRPVAVTLNPQAIAQTFVLLATVEQVGRARVDRFQDVQLHAELGHSPRVTLPRDHLLALCFNLGDLLLLPVRPRAQFTPPLSE